MLGRVARLEQARAAPKSPVEIAYGSLDAWEAEVQADIDAGKADPVDMPVILLCVRRFHADNVWGSLRAHSGVWQR